MATFPGLRPTTRALTLGDYPQLTYEGVSGDVVRFITGSDRVIQRLTLGYDYLAESEAQQIIDHYRGQQGFIVAFDLPSQVWAGYATVPIPAADYQWRYADSFQIGIDAPQRYNVTIELESVAI